MANTRAKVANEGEGEGEGEPTARVAPSGLPLYAITIEQFASQHAWRVDERGDAIPARELMGGFVHQMRQQGRQADLTANYLRDWDLFRNS